MKLKHENTIRNIAMSAFIIAMILMKIGKTPVQIILAVASCIVCMLGSIYFVHKGSKLGGAMMLFIALAVLLGILSQYFNNNILFMPVPTFLFLGFFSGYELIVKSGNKEIISQVKKPTILSLIILAVFQIVILVIASIK